MPLRDHFHPPLDDFHSWDELHGLWPAVIVQELSEILPEPYYAAPGIHLGSLYEVDVATYREGRVECPLTEQGKGDSAVATYSPPKPTSTLEPRLPDQDTYEVRIYESRRRRRLVAAIKIVSPSNKQRPDDRSVFVSKVSSLLKNDICVSIVDVVTNSQFNLFGELVDAAECEAPELDGEPSPIYAVTLRMRGAKPRQLMDNWYSPFAIGKVLPTLPIWLREDLPISIDLESSYEKACRTLKIR